MVPPPHSSRSRSGTFSPAAAAAAQSLQTGTSYSPHPPTQQTGPLSAGASPSTGSPTTGSSSLTKIVVAQVYLLLSTIKEGDKWEADAERIRNVWSKPFLTRVQVHPYPHTLSAPPASQPWVPLPPTLNSYTPPCPWYDSRSHIHPARILFRKPDTLYVPAASLFKTTDHVVPII